MGSPLSPPMANASMSSIEYKLAHNGEIQDFNKRFVVDSFTIAPNFTSSNLFNYVQLKNAHPSITLTMEIETNKELPFPVTSIRKCGTTLQTKAYFGIY